MTVSSQNIISSLLVFTLIFVPDSGNNSFINPRNIIFLLFLAVCALEGFKVNAKRLLPQKRIYIIVYTVITITMYFIHFYAGSLGEIFRFCAYFLLVNYIVRSTLTNEKQFEHYMSTIMVMSALYAFMCIVEGLTGFNVYNILLGRDISWTGANSTRYGLQRAMGISTVSINNGVMLNMLWLLAAYRVFLTKKKQLSAIIAYSVIGIAVIMNTSRAVISVAIVMQCIIILKGGIGKVAKRITIFIMCGAVVSYFFGEQIDPFIGSLSEAFGVLIDRFTSSEGGIHTSQSLGAEGDRLILWVWVYESVKDALILGKGFVSKFSYNFIARTATSSWAATKESIEVYWLYLLYRTGLIGMGGFIVYQIGTLRNLARIYKNSREQFYLIVLLITISYFILLFTVSASLGADLRMFWFILAMLFSCNYSREYAEAKSRGDEIQ